MRPNQIHDSDTPTPVYASKLNDTSNRSSIDWTLGSENNHDHLYAHHQRGYDDIGEKLQTILTLINNIKTDPWQKGLFARVKKVQKGIESRTKTLYYNVLSSLENFRKHMMEPVGSRNPRPNIFANIFVYNHRLRLI